MGVRRIRATVAYDGTDFLGFQRQAAGVRTVQGEVEAALERITETKITVAGAGRTDTGVHATGQVIAFNVTWSHPLDALMRALNMGLPDDVAVHDVAECAAEFHPRFDALSRTYEYAACVSDVRQPLRRRHAWQLERKPDVASMNEAASSFIGTHDFAAFGTAPSGREDESTVRDVIRADWREARDGLVFTIEANAFLFRMVRRMVMALVRAGQGQLNPAELREIVASRDAQRIKGLAPACGLCLVKVKYQL